jgi:hypothetical protein
VWIAVRRSSSAPVLLKPCSEFGGAITILPRSATTYRIVHVNRSLTLLDDEDLRIRMPVQRRPATRRRIHQDQRYRHTVVGADELVRIGRPRQVLDPDDWVHVKTPG